jgi:hypothetical protein
MAYLTEAKVRARAGLVTRHFQKTAYRVLSEATAPAEAIFDVFLSHSSAELEEIVLGVKLLLENRGLKIYVDKYSDPQLSPDIVTPATAKILRGRMRRSSALLYIYSRHSRTSRWMPWELGFFDGLKGTVGIIPVTRNQEETFKGEEYLNLYPYVDEELVETTKRRELWINKSPNVYAALSSWVRGEERIRPRI